MSEKDKEKVYSFSADLANLFKDVKEKMGAEFEQSAKSMMSEELNKARQEAVTQIRAEMGLGEDRVVKMSELPAILRKIMLEETDPAKRTKTGNKDETPAEKGGGADKFSPESIEKLQAEILKDGGKP